MRILQFTVAIPAALLLNANQRYGWHQKARYTKQIRTITWARAHAHRSRAMPAADCTVHIYWHDKRRRDEHNYYPTLKAAIDGVVDAGLIPDDSTKYLTGPDIRVGEGLSATPGHVELTFQFTERSVS